MTTEERQMLEARQEAVKKMMRILLPQLEKAREAHYHAYGRYSDAKREYEKIERQLAELEKVTKVPYGRSGKRDLKESTAAKNDPEAFLKSLSQAQKDRLLEELGLLQ